MKSEKKALIFAAVFLGSVILSSCRCFDVKIDEKHFPDRYFRMYVSDYFDITKDGYLDFNERTAVTSIDISGGYISDTGKQLKISCLDGIEFFTELQYLDCSENSIASIDVRGMSELESLDCSDNPVAELNARGCRKLSELYCMNSVISSMDLRDCPKLRFTDFCTADSNKDGCKTNK